MKYNRLGFVDTIVKAASGMMQPRPGMPATAAPQPGQPSGSTTVSPVMQQAFTPQFSPVLQQAQDSPGLTQAASPTQTATPSQAARTGAPLPGGSRTPGVPGQADYYAPSPRGMAFPEAFPDPYSRPVLQDNQGGMSDTTKMALLAAAAVGTIALVGDKKKGRKK